MRIATRTRYGVRFMIALAFNYQRGATFLKDIAKKEEISEKYLSQIVIALKASNLVNATRGAHGGYTLSRVPSEITLKEIIDSLEGGIAIVECTKNSKCKKISNCIARSVWVELEKNICGTLNAISLQTLVDRHMAAEFSYNI